MSLNTRSELEEERRLFYVALTRAEHQAYLTYAQSRYRWGKLLIVSHRVLLKKLMISIWNI